MRKGAVFDMDGLLLDTESVYHMVWKKEAEERNIELDPLFLKKISGSSREGAIALIAQYYGTADGTEIYMSGLARAAAYNRAHVKEMPGAHELLSYLQDSGVKRAVASSTHRSLVEEELKRAGLFGFFDAIITGEDVTNGKPAPDIFLKACAELGLVSSDCYVLEDSFNGVRAGHASGAFTIMVPDMNEPDAEMKEKADAICRDLYEVKEKMERGVF